MGAAISSQVSSNIINNSFNIANTFVTSCGNSNESPVNIITNGNCTQRIDQVNIDNNFTVNINCIQNASTNSSLQSTINTQILNQAKAAAQSLGGLSVSVATQIQDFAQSTSASITNQASVECVNQTRSSVNIDCLNGSQEIGIVNISNKSGGYLGCVNDAAFKSKLVVGLSNIISNTVSAQEANTLVSVIIIILLFLGIFGIVFVRSLNGPIGWAVLIILVVVILGLIIYAAVAFSRKLYPFNVSS